MANIQLEAFGELFTSDAAKQRFTGSNYHCPFDSRIPQCDKPNQGELRYGNCSAKVGEYKRIICPRRFYENHFQILKDIKEFIWKPGTEVDCYDELGIQIKTDDGDSFHYGNLDWLLINHQNQNDFCGIEIQTDATTGTGAFRTGISDLQNDSLKNNYGFGLNTLASFKGFLPQFIFKGQLFDDWKKPYCAVIQDELWNKFIRKFRIRYKEISTYSTETFLFFVYKLELNEQGSAYVIKKDRIFSSRWIDLLFSFSVENELLINLAGIRERIDRKISNNQPVITFSDTTQMSG